MTSRAGVSALLAFLLAGAACSKAVVSPDGSLIGPAARPAAVDDDPDSSRSAAAARVATRYLGTPYVRAGSSPAGFDCSGLVAYAFARVGVSIPHSAARQYRYGTPVPRHGLVPGDVVFFDGLRHNGVYLGDGRFIHATKPGGVKIARLDDEWFRSRWVGARRL